MADKNMPWGVHTIHDVIAAGDLQAQADSGSWGPIVLSPYHGKRLIAAWWVLTGRAHALRWPTVDELHGALNLPNPKVK